MPLLKAAARSSISSQRLGEHPKCVKTLIALTPSPIYGIQGTRINYFSPLPYEGRGAGGEGKDLIRMLPRLETSFKLKLAAIYICTPLQPIPYLAQIFEMV
jgi:hypothetical protein